MKGAQRYGVYVLLKVTANRLISVLQTFAIKSSECSLAHQASTRCPLASEQPRVADKGWFREGYPPNECLQLDHSQEGVGCELTFVNREGK